MQSKAYKKPSSSVPCLTCRIARTSTALGAVYKGRPANGEGGGGVVLKFRTFPDGGRGWFLKVRTSENCFLKYFTDQHNRIGSFILKLF